MTRPKPSICMSGGAEAVVGTPSWAESLPGIGSLVPELGSSLEGHWLAHSFKPNVTLQGRSLSQVRRDVLEWQEGEVGERSPGREARDSWGPVVGPSLGVQLSNQPLWSPAWGVPLGR